MRQVPQGASSLLPTMSKKDGRGGLGGKPWEQVEKRVPEPRVALSGNARDRPSPTRPPNLSRELAVPDWRGGRREHEDETTETSVV